MSEEAITLIRRSAKGDMTSHRALAELSIAVALEATGRGEDAFLPYYEASIFCRMAAASGLLPDRARLMSVLAVCTELAIEQGSFDDAAVFNAEGLAIAELVADGDESAASEFAAQMIVNHGGECSPEILEMAKEFKQLWGAKE